jgi:type IV pilus assembly protein PilW
MNQLRGLDWQRSAPGFTLIELLVALALTGLLVLGLAQMAAAASAAGALQRNQAQLLDRARFVHRILGRNVREAGFHPMPWASAEPERALGDATADSAAFGEDRLSLKSWSDRNCFGNRNPDLDGAGRPAFYLREDDFEVTGSRHLAHSCRYGPTVDALTTQIRRHGLVPGVESFQLLFAQDRDGDRAVDSWVRAGDWADPARVRGVRVGLLLAGDDAVASPERSDFAVLDERVATAGDGRLRRIYDFTVALRGRSE